MAVEKKFTQGWVERVKEQSERVTYRDVYTDGLLLVVHPTGRKVFAWYRKSFGKPVYKNIGKFPEYDYAKARAEALRWNANVEDGKDPFVQAGDATLGEVFERYRDDYIADHAAKPAKAVKAAKWQFDKYLSAWKDRKLDTIHEADVAKLQRDIKAASGTYSSNRAMQMLRAIINYAIAKKLWGGENPVEGIELYKEYKRKRFVQPEEMQKIALQLQTADIDLRDFVVLALTTGARKSDVCSMRWQDILKDATGARFWAVPQPKNDEEYNIPLHGLAQQILDARHARNGKSEYVFPSKSKSGHLLDPKKAWDTFRKKVGATDLRIHDLRRTLGSWMTGSGSSLKITGAALGHKSSDATEVYARLNLAPVRAAVDVAVNAMQLALPEKASA